MTRIWALLLAVSGVCHAQQQKIVVTDLTRIKQVGAIVKTNDAKKVVYEVKSVVANSEKPLEFEYLSQLYMLDTDNPKNQTPLTSKLANASQPSLSFDGKSLAFVRTVKDKPQIFIMPTGGGEPWQLTYSKYGANEPQFSPDGKSLLYSATLTLTEILQDTVFNPSKLLPMWSIEKPGLTNEAFLTRKKEVSPNPDGDIQEIRAYLAKNVEDKKAKVINRLNFQGESGVEPEIKFSHIFSIELNENAQAKAITAGFDSYSKPKFSKDGLFIYTTSASDAEEHPDREQETAILKINLANKDRKTLLSQANRSYSGISLSTNNQKIAFVVNTPGLLSYGQLTIANADGSQIQVVDFDRVPNNLVWSADDKFLYFTAFANGGVPLYRLNVATLKVETLTDFNSGIGSFCLLDDSRCLFAKNDIYTPNELFISDLKSGDNQQLTQLNTEWMKNKKISIPEKRVYVNSLGQKVDFWIMKPTFIEAGKKYPLVLQLHGGPTAMWGPGEASMWHEFQYFCSQGYGVVYPNQRGSGGYGKSFQFSNYQDWGQGPAEDALAACQNAAQENWVDTSRLVITGGSYAGYLTAWIIAKDHRFKAAFAQRGVYDLSTFMGEGNAWRLVPNYFGLPWEPEADTKIVANSPYTFVDKIRTPFLIKHGENDLRTGVVQSEMMYKSLKYLNREVEYVRMPGGTHELSRTGNVRQRIDRMLRIYEFFERYVGKAE
jgi:dipeptidyl aminopeptidase/acylaminoacyl peptidase